ncbi:hypothetical protein NUW54_g11223 [Trametes sanguinea]|uniref:Uncharacterized protein n=1 Tax=Trametes sanguinea TaxID=158606 RepID=A0ACC1NIP0_9APHY|nr:hypothetical protein NUW54_g11223 [Trametes sanguinea]
MSTHLATRGECVQNGCGTCASFVYLIDGGIQRRATDPHQQCPGCQVNVWPRAVVYVRVVGGSTRTKLRGDRTYCAHAGHHGFPMSLLIHRRPRTSRRHSVAEPGPSPGRLPIGLSGSSLPIVSAPPIPALSLHSSTLPQSSTTDLPVSTVPPVTAFSGLRLPTEGSTNDRRVASAQRHSTRAPTADRSRRASAG